jgi:hypothetical protein
MIETVPYHYIERRAWGIMVAAFCALVICLASIFYAVRWFVFESETSQEAAIALISGNISYTPPAGNPIVIEQAATDLSENTRLDTEPGSQAAISFSTTDETTVLGEIQVYGGSRVTLNEFRSPRFDWSTNPHHMSISLQRGRARVSLAVDVQRQVVIVLMTPHGEVRLDRSGSYSIEVTDQSTEVVVRDGAATVSSADESVILANGERTRISAGSPPEGVLTGERNLVLNGDFASPLSPADWNPTIDYKDPNDAKGQYDLTVDAGRNTVHFLRLGRDWGRISIEQRVNRDVRDYQSLTLHLALKLVRQNLLVCGGLGSECPLAVRVDYVDRAGGNKSWVQGFYFLGDTSGTVATLCVQCPEPRQAHLLVQPNVWVPYDSPNLIELLDKPAIISSITVYAEGHTFESFVSEIELQAGE